MNRGCCPVMLDAVPRGNHAASACSIALARRDTHRRRRRYRRGGTRCGARRHDAHGEVGEVGEDRQAGEGQEVGAQGAQAQEGEGGQEAGEGRTPSDALIRDPRAARLPAGVAAHGQRGATARADGAAWLAAQVAAQRDAVAAHVAGARRSAADLAARLAAGAADRARAEAAAEVAAALRAAAGDLARRAAGAVDAAAAGAVARALDIAAEAERADHLRLAAAVERAVDRAALLIEVARRAHRWADRGVGVRPIGDPRVVREDAEALDAAPPRAAVRLLVAGEVAAAVAHRAAGERDAGGEPQREPHGDPPKLSTSPAPCGSTVGVSRAVAEDAARRSRR